MTRSNQVLVIRKKSRIENGREEGREELQS